MYERQVRPVRRGMQAPEPKQSATKAGPVKGDGLGPRPAGAGWVAKQKAVEKAAKQARAKRLS